MTQFVGPLDYKGLYVVRFSIQFNSVQSCSKQLFTASDITHVVVFMLNLSFIFVLIHFTMVVRWGNLFKRSC